MKVKMINKQGISWEFPSVADANQHLKKGWKEKTVKVGDCLEIDDRDDDNGDGA